MIAPTNTFYPEQSGSALLVVYRLDDPQAWDRARRDRAAWGRNRCIIHTLDLDHIVLEFLPGGALDARAS